MQIILLKLKKAAKMGKTYVITEKKKSEEQQFVKNLSLSERVTGPLAVGGLIERLKKSFELDPQIMENFGSHSLFYKATTAICEELTENIIPEPRSSHEYDIVLALQFLEQSAPVLKKADDFMFVCLSNTCKKSKCYLVLKKGVITLGLDNPPVVSEKKKNNIYFLKSEGL